MDKYMRFLRNISNNDNTQTPRARRRKMERELNKLNSWKNNENKSGSTESTDKTSWRQANLMLRSVIRKHSSSMNEMTEQEILDELESSLLETQPGVVAHGFLTEDVKEFGFEGWLKLPASEVADSFYEASHEVSDRFIDDYLTLINQEETLDELGIEQSMRMSPIGYIRGLRTGLLEIFHAMSLYLESQEYAQYNYEKNE